MKALLAVGALALLAGCTSLAATAVVGTKAALDDKQVVWLQQRCARYGGLLDTIAVVPGTTGKIAGYGAAYCRELNRGYVPATTDSNTLSWLDDILSKLR